MLSRHEFPGPVPTKRPASQAGLFVSGAIPLLKARTPSRLTGESATKTQNVGNRGVNATISRGGNRTQIRAHQPAGSGPTVKIANLLITLDTARARRTKCSAWQHTSVSSERETCRAMLGFGAATRIHPPTPAYISAITQGGAGRPCPEPAIANHPALIRPSASRRSVVRLLWRAFRRSIPRAIMSIKRTSARPSPRLTASSSGPMAISRHSA